jgi:hypothetical protein
MQMNNDLRIKMLRPNTVWKHFKGSTAVILTLAKHSETNESLVVYRCIGNMLSNHEDGIYARPLEMFLSEVDKEKYPECKQKYRFELIG